MRRDVILASTCLSRCSTRHPTRARPAASMLSVIPADQNVHKLPPIDLHKITVTDADKTDMHKLHS